MSCRLLFTEITLILTLFNDFVSKLCHLGLYSVERYVMRDDRVSIPDRDRIYLFATGSSPRPYPLLNAYREPFAGMKVNILTSS